jgi:hypothetical protein
MNIKATVTQNGTTTAKVTPQQNVLVTNPQSNINNVVVKDVTTPVGTTAKVTPQQSILVTNYQVSLSNITLNDLIDVEIINIQDGALLSYNQNTQSWKAINVIDNPNTQFNGGFF